MLGNTMQLLLLTSLQQLRMFGSLQNMGTLSERCGIMNSIVSWVDYVGG